MGNFPSEVVFWQRFCWQSANDVRVNGFSSNKALKLPIWYYLARVFSSVVCTGSYNGGLYSGSPKGAAVCVSVIVMALRGHASEWHERCRLTCNAAGLAEIVWKAREVWKLNDRECFG